MISSLFPRHYETGKHPRTQVFLGDEEYSKALDCLTKACTDLFVVNEETKKILIGKRKVQPQPDWWYGAGGRMKPGENCYESASRILKRELGFVLPKENVNHIDLGGRFLGVGAYSYTWEMREQAPKTNGCADISCVLAIEVTPNEISSFKMDNQEYETHEWMNGLDVVNDETKHPALRRSVADYLKTIEWNQLQKLILASTSEQNDAVIGKEMKLFLQKWSTIDSTLDSTSNKEEKRQKLCVE